jgi:hypothetical protein
VPLAQAHQALADVGAGRDVHAQPLGRVLVDEAPVGARQQALLGLAHREDLAQAAGSRLELHAARVGLVARRHRIEQGGLAGARLAHDGQHLAGPEVEARVLQRDAVAVALADAAHAQQRLGRSHDRAHWASSSMWPAGSSAGDSGCACCRAWQ